MRYAKKLNKKRFKKCSQTNKMDYEMLPPIPQHIPQHIQLTINQLPMNNLISQRNYGFYDLSKPILTRQTRPEPRDYELLPDIPMQMDVSQDTF